MKRLLVPIFAAVVALGARRAARLRAALALEDDSIEQAVARGEFPPAPSAELPVLGAETTQSVAALRGRSSC